MPSLVKMAEHLGITKTRVCQLKKRGMPMSSFKAADKWREKEELKRTPTNNCKNAAVVKEKELKKKMDFASPSRSGDSLLDALNNSIAVADAAFEDYQLARQNPELNRSARLSEHNKAIDARLKAEEAYRKEQERRGILVPKAEITEMVRRCIDAVLRRLRKLPQEQGPQCNPSEPLMAVKILEREVNDIIASGQRALEGFDQ
jgi:hypothetical protein